MTGETGRQAAIADARALLEVLSQNGWQEAHVIVGGTEIFIARDGGRVNPMRVATAAPSLASLADRCIIDVTAPHVATLVGVAALGTQVFVGQTVATIAVLGKDEEVLALKAGTVFEVAAAPGDLLEFGTLILTLSGLA